MNKIIITQVEDNVVTNIVDTAELVSNGLLVTSIVDNKEDKYVIGCYNETDFNKFDAVEVTADIAPQKYLYDGTTFTLNPNYVEHKTPEQRIAELEKEKEASIKRITDLELAIASMMGV